MAGGTGEFTQEIRGSNQTTENVCNICCRKLPLNLPRKELLMSKLQLFNPISQMEFQIYELENLTTK